MIYRRSTIFASLCLTTTISVTSFVYADVSGPNDVYTVTPCRVLDTRSAYNGFQGPLYPGDTLDIDVYGDYVIDQGGNPWGCPEIPYNANGVFINIIAVDPAGAMNNDLGISPYGSRSAATAINYEPGVFALSNGLYTATCSGCWYNLTLHNGQGASAHFVIDVTGFTLPR
jgi:hypothetical protein